VPLPGAAGKGVVLVEGADAVAAGGIPSSDAVAAAAVGGATSETNTTG
jgi:hypothetical protein